jgi:hypothetical protein
MSRSPNRSIVEHVDEVKRKIERVPVGVERATLELKFSQTVVALAGKIRDAARQRKP